jgi:hypothetical protein
MATDSSTKEKPQQSGDTPEAGTPTGSGLPPSPPPSEDELIESAQGSGSTTGQAPTQTPSPSTTGDPGTLSGAPLKDLDDGDPRQPQEVSGAAAVKASAQGRKLSEEEQTAALDWLLKADPDPGELETKVLDLNFGTSDRPMYVPWEIQPVGLDRMRDIRNAARNSRQARKTGQVDETRMNLQIIVAGTKTPDVRQAAEIARSQGNGTGDPVEILRARFQSKPGYIAQISAEIMSLSGFDDEDVQEKDMIEAAGNS